MAGLEGSLTHTEGALGVQQLLGHGLDCILVVIFLHQAQGQDVQAPSIPGDLCQVKRGELMGCSEGDIPPVPPVLLSCPCVPFLLISSFILCFRMGIRLMVFPMAWTHRGSWQEERRARMYRATSPEVMSVGTRG